MKRFFCSLAVLVIATSMLCWLCLPRANAQTTGKDSASPSETQRAAAEQQERINQYNALVRQQEDRNKRVETLLERQEQLMTRQEAAFGRFEKVLDTWERQQNEYQKYLDSLKK
jgi:hypothetical protein